MTATRVDGEAQTDGELEDMVPLSMIAAIIKESVEEVATANTAMFIKQWDKLDAEK